MPFGALSRKQQTLGPAWGGRSACRASMRLLSLPLLAGCALAGCQRPPAEPSLREGAPEAPRLARQLDADLLRVREEASRLATVAENLYANKEQILPEVDRSKYASTPDGAFHKPINDGTGALWISGSTPITDSVREAAFFTEPLDHYFLRTTRDFPEVSQAHFNTKDNLSRIYPWVDAMSQYPPRMDNAKFQFYYLADAKHNPSREALWVDEPYVDPAGRGWTVSATAPVYAGGEMQGVVALDVTISTIIDRYFKSRQVPIVVLARNGVVVAATEKAIELLEMPPLKDHKYLQAIQQDTFQPEDYNAAKSPVRGVRDMARQILEKGALSVDVQLAGKTYTAVASPVRETGWRVVEFVAK